MSTADQFRQYAEEAMRWARQSKTEKEKQVLMELAHTWTQAAFQSESTVVVNYSPPEHRAALAV
jgi:glucose-6-phosphate isomerase